jgi:hypothetical protein
MPEAARIDGKKRKDRTELYENLERSSRRLYAEKLFDQQQMCR